MAAINAPEDRPALLAKRLGLTGYDAPRRVARWRDDENTPHFEQTLALLELAGWLNEKAIRRHLSEEAAQSAEQALSHAKRAADQQQQRRSDPQARARDSRKRP